MAFLLMSSPLSFAQQLFPIENASIVVCPASAEQMKLPSFTEKNCRSKTISEVDPQNNAIWLKANLKVSAEMLKEQPLALFIFGKTSSEAYLNGHYLGNNGTPSFYAADEYTGKMDVMFYAPQQWLKTGNNEIVLRLSAHHGFISLNAPINFIGLGKYAPPSAYFQRSIPLVLLGALLIGTIYLLVLTLQSANHQKYVLFLLMSFFASGQLFAEISRGLFNYNYPIHDIRLITIVLLSISFGCCLLIYVINKFTAKNKMKWLILSMVLTLVSVTLIPGFDAKTATAILVPTLISIFLLVMKYRLEPSKQALSYTFVFTIFSVIIIATLTTFHDMMYYYLITGMMIYLFAKQARELVNEQNQRQAEEQQVAKLQFKLDQNKQLQTPKKLTLTSSGKTELILTQSIIYCKAAGDYVELFLSDKQQRLYSGSLKSIEDQLPSTFLKVHRSYIVNLDSIVSLSSSSTNEESKSTSSGYLILTDNVQVPVSRRILPMVRGVINKT